MTITRKKSILIICPFPKNVAAGQRLKYEQYLDDWNSRGYIAEISNFIDHSTWKILYKKGHFIEKIIGFSLGYVRRFRDLFRLRNYDCIYVFMWVTPYFSTLFERLFLLLSKKVIFDLEDNIMIKNKIFRDNNPNFLANLIKNPNKQLILAKYSDAVITSSPELENICRDLNLKKKAFYITSSIDTNIFRPSQNKKANKITIGWTGTFSSKEYLNLVEEALQELHKEVDFKLHIIGNFEYELSGVDLQVSKWSLNEEVKQMQTFDIGIYPLPNDQWVSGKSGLKAIQYMAYGIPTVASRVGNTPNIISDKVEGILVESKKEWILALKMLINNKELREQMGKNARQKAIRDYSLNIVSESYAKVLNLCFKN